MLHVGLTLPADHNITSFPPFSPVRICKRMTQHFSPYFLNRICEVISWRLLKRVKHINQPGQLFEQLCEFLIRQQGLKRFFIFYLFFTSQVSTRHSSEQERYEQPGLFHVICVVDAKTVEILRLFNLGGGYQEYWGGHCQDNARNRWIFTKCPHPNNSNDV